MKRIFFTIIFAVILLAGCGGGGGGSSDTGNPSGGSGTLGVATSTVKGTPTGAAMGQTVGPSGGTVSNGSITLTIPAGALSADTLISITPITNTAHSGTGPAFDLAPDGLTFAKPIEVKMQLSDQDLGQNSIEAFNIAYQDSSGYWYGAADPITDPAAKTITILTDHFTSYASHQWYIIQPAFKEVRVNKTAEFEVRLCEMTLEGDPDPFLKPYSKKYFDSVLFDCSETSTAEPGNISVLEPWNVDGIPGGNPQRGFINPVEKFIAEYRAPSSVPKPSGKENVWITVVKGWNVPGGSSKYFKKMKLSAVVKIIEDADYRGSIQYKTEGPVNFTADIAATFTLVPEITGGKYYKMDAYVLPSDITLNMTGQCKWVCRAPGRAYFSAALTGATALQIYDVPANTYDFKFLLNPPAPIMGDCVDYCSNPPRSLTMALPIFVGFGRTTTIGNYPFKDINLLEGSDTTSAGGDQKSTATWTIEKLKE